LIKFPSMI